MMDQLNYLKTKGFFPYMVKNCTEVLGNQQKRNSASLVMANGGLYHPHSYAVRCLLSPLLSFPSLLDSAFSSSLPPLLNTLHFSTPVHYYSQNLHKNVHTQSFEINGNIIYTIPKETSINYERMIFKF